MRDTKTEMMLSWTILVCLSQYSLTDVEREQLCPARNEFSVAAAGMSCVKKCSEDQDCNNEKKLCLCDGLCGLSCIRPERECPELPDPPNGQVSLTGRHFQDSAVYSCDEGFTLVGVRSHTCQASGRWSGRAPECGEWRGNTASPPSRDRELSSSFNHSRESKPAKASSLKHKC